MSAGSRLARLAAVVTAVILAGCEGGFLQNPAPEGTAALALDLTATSAGGSGEAFDRANRVWLRVSAGGRIRLEQIVPVKSGGRDVQLPLDVVLRRRTEDLKLDIELRLGDVPLFRGSTTVRARIGGRQTLSISLLPVAFAFVLPSPLPPLTAFGDALAAEGAIVFASGDTLSIGPVEQWTSLDPAIVGVEGGVPVARAEGTARLVGRNGELVDTTTVQVLANVLSIAIDPNGAQIPFGTARQFSATLFDRRGNTIEGRSPAWSSSDPSLVRVDDSGNATAEGLGTVTLTAASGTASTSVQVQAVPAPPDVETDTVLEIMHTTATFWANVRANGAATELWFVYATDSLFTSPDSTPVIQVPAGITLQKIPVAATSLSSGVTYYVRAWAKNAKGTDSGRILRFTTLSSGSGGSFSAQTGAFIDPCDGTATILGNVFPAGAPAQAWVQWGTDPGLTVALTTPPVAIPASAGAVPISVQLTGISSGVTYFYRVLASNAQATVSGAIRVFTACQGSGPGNAPAVNTAPATAVSMTGAALNGAVNPNGSPATAWFDWSTDPLLAAFNRLAPQPVGAGTTSLAVTSPLAGLSPNTTYYFRAGAANAADTTLGTIRSFTTLVDPAVTPPSAATDSAAPVWADSAYLHATVNPEGGPTTVRFEYGTSAGGLSSTTVTAAVGSGSTPLQIALRVTGLTPGVTYFYRVVAQSPGGTATGAVLSFTTLPGLPGAPTATTDPAVPIQGDSAMLNGTVNPNGSDGVAWFEWGTDPTLASFTATAAQPAGAGSFAVSVAELVEPLTPAATYYFRVVIQTIAGTVRGNILSFLAVSTGGGGPPSATTLPATDITSNAATLNGTANPNGAPTAVWFEYWIVEAGVFVRTAPQFIGSGAAVPVSLDLTGLVPGAPYRFRVFAFNAHGTAFGAILELNVPPPD